MKRVFSKKIIILAYVCLVLGCQREANTTGAVQVRIPLEGGNGQYSPQTVVLNGVQDLSAMSTQYVTVRAEGSPDMRGDPNGNITSVTPSYGNSPSGKFIKIGTVYYPADFFTSSMTAVMYHFENIKNFFDKLEANTDLSFPRMVMYNVEIYKVNGFRYREVDNASYQPMMDAFWIHPYDQSNIPLAFNGGVLAHEYTHSIVDRRLRQVVDKVFQTGALSLDEANAFKAQLTQNRLNEWDDQSPLATLQQDTPVRLNPFAGNDVMKANFLFYRAINEAVADYFGYEYSHNPGFISASLPTLVERDLSVRKSFSKSAPETLRWVKASFANPHQAISEHTLGTYFSHLLYIASCPHGDNYACPADAWGDELTQQRVLSFISRYGNELATHGKTDFISMGKIVSLLFAEAHEKSENSALCRAAANMFAGELTPQSLCGAGSAP